ncbi:MinD/ParA family protein [Mycobacterium sp. E796]|uniref:MinD/ParA family ATP-binding protein n=1 Tax=Mycobacterium sp. E796 TaxID=1834151 RepID=UPI0009EE6763|nr:MinD/ParA family protein [Mycobacterium sp. E796]
MTEHRGADSDDHASSPAVPAGPPEALANGSGPVPSRPQDDKPDNAARAPETPNDAPYQWPDQPAFRHGGPLDETATLFDRSRTPGGTRGRGREFGPAPGRLEADQYGGPRPDGWAAAQQPPASGAASPPRPDVPADPSGPAWPQPQQQAAAPPAGGPGWAQAQRPPPPPVNYVDSIRRSDLVPTRRIPPGRGWRKAVYVASFKLINLGWSPDERYQAELEAKIRTLLRGTYKIGVLGKGGVGKSTIAASVGSVFAELRNDDRVVAIDADTSYGKLASRIDPSTASSYWELASDRHLFSFADIRARVGSNRAGLFVLAGDAATAGRRVLDPAIYREATTQLDKHFTLSIVDCGSSLDSPVTQEVLAGVDALIVVSSPWYDGASAAAQALDWLANHGFNGLLQRTVVVVNDSDGHAAKRDIALLAERFGGRGQKVIEIPFDGHLRPGGVIDVKDEVNRTTRRRLLELAAACAEHFTTTAGRPRGL